MPTKKKATVKAKKEGKDAKTEVAEKTTTTNQSLEANTQRLKIGNETQDDDDAFLDEAIKLAAAEKKELATEEKKAAKILMSHNCTHGCDPLPGDSDCGRFMHTFWDEYTAGHNRGENHIIAVSNATKAAHKKIPEVMVDYVKVGWVLSHFLAIGTKDIIDGETEQARLNASIAIHFEQIIAINIRKTQATWNCANMIEMLNGDEHTLVKYLRKLTPCKCLDEKYKEVKSITKMGFCSNPMCSLPDHRMVERKGMLHCIRCRLEYYCSRECQEADWPMHKKLCNKYVDEQAEIDANLKDAK